MPCLLFSMGCNPGNHCIGGWVGPETGPDVLEMGKVSCPAEIRAPDRPVRNLWNLVGKISCSSRV